MPNWCNNTITISGPIRTIEKLYYDHTVKDADDETGLLDGMRPMPVELHDTTSPSDEANWYDWRVANWGTKWEVGSEGLEYSEDPDNGTAEITGWFDSAWAPPVEAYNYFIENNKDCHISAMWHEPGMDFGGEYEDGEIDECDDLHAQYKTAEDLQSPLFQRLDEWFGISESYEMWEEEDE